MANISDGQVRWEGWLPFQRTCPFEMEAIPASRRDLTKMACCCVG